MNSEYYYYYYYLFYYSYFSLYLLSISLSSSSSSSSPHSIVGVKLLLVSLHCHPPRPTPILKHGGGFISMVFFSSSPPLFSFLWNELNWKQIKDKTWCFIFMCNFFLWRLAFLWCYLLHLRLRCCCRLRLRLSVLIGSI